MTILKRNPIVLSIVAEALTICLLGAFWIRATLATKGLKQESDAVQKRLTAARQAKTTMEEFEHAQEAFTRQERELARAIPVNAKEPLDLVKELTVLAFEAKATRVRVSIDKKTAVSPAQAATAEHLYAFPLHLDCELEFPQLIQLLKKLQTLERIITVEEVQITRSPELFPRQKASLTLNAYTLSGL